MGLLMFSFIAVNMYSYSMDTSYRDWDNFFAQPASLTYQISRIEFLFKLFNVSFFQRKLSFRGLIFIGVIDLRATLLPV